MDDAHQGADRHAHDRRADARRDQDLWRRHQGDRARRDADRGGPPSGAGHAERLCGTDLGGVLRRLRLEAGRLGTLRAVHRSGPDGGDVGSGWRHRDHDDRRAGALPGERAVLPRLPQRRRSPEARAGAHHGRTDAGAAGAVGGRQARLRTGDAPQRERDAQRLRVRRCRRPRHR